MREDKLCLFITADNPMLIESASSLEDRFEIQIILTNWRNSLKSRCQISKTYTVYKVLHFHTAQIQARQELVRQQPCGKEGSTARI